ncbi:hypothetical protein [Lacticaseibacillus sp. N501-2]|uniref:hypothetical protein n=1 Tax=Lacticaseibacillus salsurae TaxID=3367729 RepID=UPI0038B2482C
MATKSKAPQWTKVELLSAVNLTGAERDVMMVALNDGKLYTIDEAKAAIKKTKGGLY